MQPTKISTLKVSFGQNVTRYQYMLKQLSVELKACICSTLNFNQGKSNQQWTLFQALPDKQL